MQNSYNTTFGKKKSKICNYSYDPNFIKNDMEVQDWRLKQRNVNI